MSIHAVQKRVLHCVYKYIYMWYLSCSFVCWMWYHEQGCNLMFFFFIWHGTECHYLHCNLNSESISFFSNYMDVESTLLFKMSSKRNWRLKQPVDSCTELREKPEIKQESELNWSIEFKMALDMLRKMYVLAKKVRFIHFWSFKLGFFCAFLWCVKWVNSRRQLLQAFCLINDSRKKDYFSF